VTDPPLSHYVSVVVGGVNVFSKCHRRKQSSNIWISFIRRPPGVDRVSHVILAFTGIGLFRLASVISLTIFINPLISFSEPETISIAAGYRSVQHFQWLFKRHFSCVLFSRTPQTVDVAVVSRLNALILDLEFRLWLVTWF